MRHITDFKGLKKLLFAAMVAVSALLLQASNSAPEEEVVNPHFYEPDFSADQKAELLTTYVDKLADSVNDYQKLDEENWKSFNKYLMRTVPFFSAKDRRKIMALLVQKNNTEYFSDLRLDKTIVASAENEIDGIKGVLIDKTEGMPINTEAERETIAEIRQADMWPVMFHYLAALKPVSTEQIKEPPAAFRYDMQESQAKNLLLAVRKDLKAADMEVSDVLAFMSRKSFFASAGLIQRDEFDRVLAVNRIIAKIREKGVPGLAKPAPMDEFWKKVSSDNHAVNFSEEDKTRIIGYGVLLGLVKSDAAAKDKAAMIARSVPFSANPVADGVKAVPQNQTVLPAIGSGVTTKSIDYGALNRQRAQYYPVVGGTSINKFDYSAFNKYKFKSPSLLAPVNSGMYQMKYKYIVPIRAVGDQAVSTFFTSPDTHVYIPSFDCSSENLTYEEQKLCYEPTDCQSATLTPRQYELCSGADEKNDAETTVTGETDTDASTGTTRGVGDPAIVDKEKADFSAAVPATKLQNDRSTPFFDLPGTANKNATTATFGRQNYDNQTTLAGTKDKDKDKDKDKKKKTDEDDTNVNIKGGSKSGGTGGTGSTGTSSPGSKGGGGTAPGGQNPGGGNTPSAGPAAKVNTMMANKASEALAKIQTAPPPPPPSAGPAERPSVAPAAAPDKNMRPGPVVAAGPRPVASNNSPERVTYRFSENDEFLQWNRRYNRRAGSMGGGIPSSGGSDFWNASSFSSPWSQSRPALNYNSTARRAQNGNYDQYYATLMRNYSASPKTTGLKTAQTQMIQRQTLSSSPQSSSFANYEMQAPLSIDQEYYSDYDSAMLASNIALRKNPNDSKALIKRGNASYGLKRYRDAITDCSAAVKITPSLFKGYEIMAWSHYKLGNYKDAYDNAERALSLNAGDVEAILARGKASERLGDYRQMLGDLKKLSDMDKKKYGKMFQEALSEYGDKAPEFLVYADKKPISSKQGALQALGKMDIKLKFFLGVMLLGALGFALAYIMQKSIAGDAPVAASAGAAEAAAAAAAVTDEESGVPVRGVSAILNKYQPELLVHSDDGGVVYSGTNVDLDLKVAIKKIQYLSPEEKEKLQNNAHSFSSIRHPNVAELFQVAEQDGAFYAVSEFACGKTIEKRIEDEGPLSFSFCKTAFKGVAQGLEYMHNARVYQGLIKPSDIKTENDGFAKLLNPGLGTAIDRHNSDWTAYLAPELRTGAPYSEKTDVYGLAACMYRAVTGAVPDVSAGLRKPSEMADGIPSGLDELLVSSLSEKPEARPASMTDFIKALDAIKVPPPPPAPPQETPEAEA